MTNSSKKEEKSIAERRRDFRILYRFLSDDLANNGNNSVVRKFHSEVVKLQDEKREQSLSPQQKLDYSREFLKGQIAESVQDDTQCVYLKNAIDGVMSDKPEVFQAFYRLFKEDEIFRNIAPYDDPDYHQTVAGW